MKTTEPSTDVAQFASEEESHALDTRHVTHSGDGGSMDLNHRLTVQSASRRISSGPTDESMVRYYEAETRGQRYAVLATFGVLGLAALAIVLDRPAVGVTGLLMAGAAAIWAVRRRSGGPDASGSAQLDPAVDPRR